MTTVHISTFISIAKPRKCHVTHFTAMCSSLWCPEVEPRYFQGMLALNAFSAMEKKRKEKNSGSIAKTPLELYFLILKQRKPSK